ncbi:uncharacterized protein LOC122174791 [Chrysemys picta bellii]|uniref:uncharacterized protein LOC122174791 n=1 Tax=Chrysemys picta bellii TaxID=8478 RepID=UPI0032B11A72
MPFLAKSPGGARMSGREVKWQQDRESAVPRAAGGALTSLAGRSPARGSPGALRVPSRIELAEAETPFLQSDVRAILERHVQVKRLQQALGLSCTLQRALKIFMPPAPKLTARRPSGAGRVVTVPQALPFLSVGFRAELERHLQRMVHLQRWGMPSRIQESLRLFAAFAPPAGPQLRGAGGERGVGQSRLGPSQPDVPAGSRLAGDSRTHGLAAERRDKLQWHLVRKCLEIRVGVRPALVERSQRVAREGERIHLPRLICAGQKPPKPRAGSLLCLPPTATATLDMNVRHKQLVHFWGLPTPQAASLRRMMPKAPAVPLGSAAGRAWTQMGLAGRVGAEEPERKGYEEPVPLTEAGTVELLVPHPGPPLVTAEARDRLERHILRQKLQREWGLPRVVQRSLGAFTPLPPARGPPRRGQAPARESVATGSLVFLRAETRERLESHVRKLALERRWGLPQRILESLRMFLPPAPAGAEPRGQTQPPLHVCHTPPQGPTALSTGQSGELQPGPGEPLTHRSQHWHEMGVKEGKASCPKAVPQHALGSSSRRSQETSQTRDGEGPPDSPRRFPEDKAELKSTLDFPGKKVLGISHRAQESQRQALRPVAHEPAPQQREQSSEERPGRWRTHDGEGAPWLAGTGRRSRSSSVETALWSEKRISREPESSFRRMAQSCSHHGPGGKQPLSLEILGHLDMDHCTCSDCPCCQLEGRDGARSRGASSPVGQTQRLCVRGSVTLLGDAAAPSAAKDEPSASSPSSLEGSESRASAGESARAASRPAPEEPRLAGVHRAPPGAAAHRLDWLAQKTPASFLLPPCVIRSQAVCAHMAAERLRAAAQEHGREMNMRLQHRRGRKSQLGERALPAGTGEPGFPTAGSLGQRLTRESQSLATQYLCETCRSLFTAGEEGLSPLPCPPPGRGAESPSVPCKGKGPAFRGLMLAFLKRVTSRASVGKRGRVDGSVAAPRGAPPPPRKLAPSPKSVTFNGEVHMRALVTRCQLCCGGEKMDGAGRKEPAAAARTRGLPGNGAPQGSGAASPSARRGDRRRGRVTRGEGGEGVASLKAADPRQQGAGWGQSCVVLDACTAAAFISNQLDERMVVIGLILEKSWAYGMACTPGSAAWRGGEPCGDREAAERGPVRSVLGTWGTGTKVRVGVCSWLINLCFTCNLQE